MLQNIQKITKQKINIYLNSKIKLTNRLTNKPFVIPKFLKLGLNKVQGYLSTPKIITVKKNE